MRKFLIAICLALAPVPLALAQNLQQQGYVMSPEMKRQLEDRDFDAQKVEQVVNDVVRGLDSKKIGSIVDASFPEIRVWENGKSKVVKRDQLARYQDHLFKNPALPGEVTDESQFILQSDTIGLARGYFWIKEECLDDKCDQKKTAITTINLQ